MKTIEIRLPKLGESITEATLVVWLKNVGEHIAKDEPLLEVSTDKVNSEIPSPESGILIERCAHVEDILEVGALIAKIAVEDRSEQSSVPLISDCTEQLKPQAGDNRSALLTPAVLCLAQSQGLTMEQVLKISGTGAGGRITKKDVEGFLSKATPTQSFDEELLPMSSMRKAIAQNMVRSFYQAPHASLISEVDVTEIMKAITKNKETFYQTHGAKLTITSFVLEAIVKTLKHYPLLNASLQDETIIVKRYINIGIAVNIDHGLVVPVIQNCESSDIVSLARRLQEMAKRARDKKLTAKEMENGTLTLTNFGMTGTLIGIPIIRHPEVAIIGMGTIQKRVVVRDNDAFAIREMLYITLTFDHRVIDGIYGCGFLKLLKENLESISYFE